MTIELEQRGSEKSEGAAGLEKEKHAQFLISIYRVKKRPTPEDKELIKRIKSLQHGYDGEIDICVICKRLLPIKDLRVHHPGTDPASYALEDVVSACTHCDCVENGKKGSTHAAPAAAYASSAPSLRPREKSYTHPEAHELTQEQRLVKESPLTFQRRKEWEPLVREYLWRYVTEESPKQYEKAIQEAAEFSGASQQAAQKYIDTACSGLGPFRHTDNDIVCRRLEWKPGKTAMSEVDLKILQKIADENKEKAQEKESELEMISESSQMMAKQLSKVGDQRNILAQQLSKVTGKPVNQILSELGLSYDVEDKNPAIQ